MTATDPSAPWRNRIVGEGEKPASQFLAHPLNWRGHPDEQQRAIEAILTQVGWVQRVVENRRTGRLIDGHLRVNAALKRGDETPIPFVEVDLTDEEEALVLAVLDPIGDLATTDAAALGRLLEGVQVADADLGNLLKDLALTASDPASQEVSFNVEERPKCPTCGNKLKRGQTLPAAK